MSFHLARVHHDEAGNTHCDEVGVADEAKRGRCRAEVLLGALPAVLLHPH